MKRSLRLLLILAPVIVLLLGVPAGVAFARLSPPGAPVTLSPGAAGTARPGQSNRPFVGPRQLFGPPLPISAAQSGISGTITRVTPGRILVLTKGKKVALVTIDPKTTIRFRGKNVKASELMRGDTVTILGHRDSTGAFQAELVRLTHPAPPDPPPGGAR